MRQLLILIILLFSCQVQAQQCPGTMFVTQNVSAFVVSFMSNNSGDLYQFIQGGCSTMKFGPSQPTLCLAKVETTTMLPSGPYIATFQARWANSASNSTNNGCTFTCGGATCRVRGGDALPVELMEFSLGSE